nr:hypothetical protein Q903MT_gene3413 [Picea sitchensis]
MAGFSLRIRLDSLIVRLRTFAFIREIICRHQTFAFIRSPSFPFLSTSYVRLHTPLSYSFLLFPTLPSIPSLFPGLITSFTIHHSLIERNIKG